MNDIIQDFAFRLNKAMNLRNIKPIELSEKSGIDKSKISSYMSGRYKPKQDGVYKIAEILNVNPAWLIGYDVPMLNLNIEKSNSLRIPVLGSIPAGIPLELVEDILDYEEISEEMLKGDKEYFALRVKGNSMEPKYLDGDTLIILKNNDCESGQDCIVMVNGDDGTFKRVIKTSNGIALQPLNPNYEMKFYSNKEVENLPIKILGVVKEIRRTV